MKFKVQKHEKRNISLYDKKDFIIATKLAKDVMKEYGGFVKGIVLFGSTARKQAMSMDIDILVVIDDIDVMISPEFSEAYRIIMEKLVFKHSKRLHVTTLKYTTFWEYVRAGDPVAINILRDGIALIDTGFFDPLQSLLYQGRIRPTPESIRSYYERAPLTLRNSRWHLMQATTDLYWAVIDAAHAALMRIGEVPPSPAQVTHMVEEKLIKTKLIHEKYGKTISLFYKLYKMIIHNEIREIKGSEFEKYYEEAKEFVEAMEKFIANS